MLRIGKAIIKDLENIFKRHDVSLYTKTKTVYTVAFLIVMSGCESCTKKAKRRKNQFHLKCSVGGRFYGHHGLPKTNKGILNQIKCELLLEASNHDLMDATEHGTYHEKAIHTEAGNHAWMNGRQQQKKGIKDEMG